MVSTRGALPAKLIGRRRRTVVIDRPGFGEDLLADTRFTIAGEARALDVVAAMGIPSIHLVGHSYGALITLEMAVMQPEVVRSLHLIEPPLLDLLPEQPLVQEMDRRAQWIVDHHAEIGDEAPPKRSSQWSVPSARSSVCGHARLGSPLRSCHPIRAWRAAAPTRARR